MMPKRIVALAGILAVLGFVSGQTTRPNGPETILPLALLQQIIHEASGDVAFQNEVDLRIANRNRDPQEYGSTYYEAGFILKKLQGYGIENSEIIDLPTRSETTWDAESAELWVTKPGLLKLTDLKEIPACLCSGSVTSDVTAGLVYVGPGNRENDYEGKEVKDKIVLVNGMPEMARRLAVEKFGALGIIGSASSHPEHDPDQVGWSSIRVSESEKPTFAFMISARQKDGLREALERGETIEVRAVCQTQMVPYKEQMVAALLPGREFPEEELVFTAHLFEGLTMRGANDNDSGCAAVLETARVLKKLLDRGKIPPLRRSVRFLFIPEISGTAAYIREFPQISKRFFANINEDMVGEALGMNKSFFNLERPPDSLPSYLGDVLESLVLWVGETQNGNVDYDGDLPKIVSSTGSKDPFYYAIIAFAGGSDHIVFLDGGVRVPSVTFNCWPDMWYHTSGDTPDKSDPTQLKRVVFIGAAAAAFLANAGPREVQRMAAETSGRAIARLGLDKLRAERMLDGAAAKDIHEALKEALNVVDRGFEREKKALASIRFFVKQDIALEEMLKGRIDGLEVMRPAFIRDLEETYRLRCQGENLRPQKPVRNETEERLSRRVPVRTEKMHSYFNAWEFYQKVREMKAPPDFRIGRAEFEVRNFIDGRRSILDIRNAVSAEHGPVPLEGVEKYILLLEKTGFVSIEKK
jgi:aminopeptidase YwaD